MNRKQLVECHVRIHDKNGYLMSIDLNNSVDDVISHILKLRDSGCGT